jgi:hypothetical protein
MIKALRKVCGVMLLTSLVAIRTAPVKCQGIDLKGQVSSWGTGIRAQNEWKGNWGIRYIPQFNYSSAADEGDLFNAELLFNTFYGTDFHSDDYAFKFYRAILRYTTAQTETQIGLQKINFGPAVLLRSLMWFDTVDPRDPLKLTDGVYALRYKYSFLNNTLAWVWGLYGNNGTKGYEAFGTAHKTPEFGARLQAPIPAGEIAATVHTRKADAGGIEYRESRYAVDGRWDVGIGLWFEAVAQHNGSTLPSYRWNRMTTVGGDYTIPAGNGIYILGEHMVSTASKGLWTSENAKNISAAMATYPLGVLDNLTVQEYYRWSDRTLSQFFQWQRTYDNFIINAALFHSPGGSGGLFAQSKNVPVTGYGVQLMLIYNY